MEKLYLVFLKDYYAVACNMRLLELELILVLILDHIRVHSRSTQRRSIFVPYISLCTSV